MTLGDALSQTPVNDASPASKEEIQNLADRADIKGLEAMLDKAVLLENGDKIKHGLLERMSTSHRDALLLFHTLCKMCVNEDNDETTIKTRILSLELLQGLLEGVSHAITKDLYFINSVKSYLSYTLLRASISSSSIIFQRASGIFAMLLLRFRESLKGEIGIFFPLIALRYLDNAACPLNQRSVLRMLEKVCKDPQMLVDIFVNYDCDLDAPNLFECMVTSLSRIAQRTIASDPNSIAASQSVSVKHSSLQCLVNVFKSLVDWEKSHKDSEQKIKDCKSLDGRSSKDTVEIEQIEDTSSDFEKTEAHKSSTETKYESDAIIKQTQYFFRNRGTKRGVFHTSQRVELIRPMIETVGWPLLSMFSVIMEEGDNKSRVHCMEVFQAGIHITRVLGMNTMRYAFLTSLVRFTFVHVPMKMHSKNVEALGTLLALGESDADALKDTWNAVLGCISRLEFITSTPTVAATVMQASNQISRDALFQSLRELAGKPTEQFFLNSGRLPSDTVVEFFTALCFVSAEELKQKPARVYSLQKLVEISYYNMARIRTVWTRIWYVLGNHFIFAGSHHDEKVAMYAIDSLRQLGMTYLERTELPNFTFQNDILKPFVVLMQNSRSESTRRLILDCTVQMIKSKVGSIKSGWRSVFMIFTAAALDESERIIEIAFDSVEQVILEHFDQVVGYCFMDCVNCLIEFANNKSSRRISLKAIELCEDRLAEGFVLCTKDENLGEQRSRAIEVEPSNPDTGKRHTGKRTGELAVVPHLEVARKRGWLVHSPPHHYQSHSTGGPESRRYLGQCVVRWDPRVYQKQRRRV